MTDTVIKNGSIVTPGGVILGGVAIEGGKITYVGSNQGLPDGNRVIDAKQNFVIPGLIDPHVHMGVGGAGQPREVGFHMEFAKETEGALHGGITTFGNMTLLRQDESNLAVLETLVSAGQELSYVDFFFHACITSELHLEEQPELWQRGVTSFKHLFNAYKGAEGMGRLSHTDDSIALRSLDFIAGSGYPAIGLFHCEELDAFFFLSERLQQAGRNDLKAWTDARPSWIETLRMVKAFEYGRNLGAPVYIVHQSCAEAVDLMTDWRRRGYRVCGETCPHYLTHNADMEEQIGCWGKVNTSLKYPRDNERLWQGILDGGVTVLGTDHCAESRVFKERGDGGGKHGNIWKATPGISGGMEHLLPVMMTYGVNAGRISIEDFVRVGSTNPAKILGLYPCKGALAPGSDADIVLIDPDKEATVDSDFYHCLGETSIYLGWKFKGMARTVMIRGEILMEDYETVGKPGYGRFLARPLKGRFK